MLDVVLDVVLDAGSLLGIWDWNAREMEEGHHNLSFYNFEGIFVSLACDLSVCSSNPGLDVKECVQCHYVCTMSGSLTTLIVAVQPPGTIYITITCYGFFLFTTFIMLQNAPKALNHTDKTSIQYRIL